MSDNYGLVPLVIIFIPLPLTSNFAAMNSDEFAALAKAREQTRKLKDGTIKLEFSTKEKTSESNKQKGTGNTKSDDEPHVSSTTIQMKNERNSYEHPLPSKITATSTIKLLQEKGKSSLRSYAK